MEIKNAPFPSHSPKLGFNFMELNRKEFAFYLPSRLDCFLFITVVKSFFFFHTGP
jgi:hypothetical protein